MKKAKTLLVTLALLLGISCSSITASASYSRPQSAVGMYDYAGVDRITVTYMNASRARSLANKLSAPSSTWSDVYSYLYGFLPYFGPVMGVAEILDKAEHNSIASKIRATLKNHSGVCIRNDRGEGRGTGTNNTSVSGWNGKRSSTPRPYVAAPKYLHVVHPMKYRS
ncbi:hypothetical protein [Lactiplantibacillus plantarum]|uniref:hypothetical protein n=1 Tax=Lactiplantibacillus plantarum TaxID=1590 RepID=UPI0007B55112|nr:hypothetical protein [Lactiplantibacillus plantarum]